jgi:hypothetical protein
VIRRVATFDNSFPYAIPTTSLRTATASNVATKKCMDRMPSMLLNEITSLNGIGDHNIATWCGQKNLRASFCAVDTCQQKSNGALALKIIATLNRVS